MGGVGGKKKRDQGEEPPGERGRREEPIKKLVVFNSVRLPPDDGAGGADDHLDRDPP